MKIHSPATYIRYVQIRLICNKTRKCPMEETRCLNCSTLFIGNYCYKCGQKREINQLTFKSVTSNFISAFTNIERGFFTTIAELFLRPGKMIREYIAGKRVNYTNPFQLLFVLAAVYTFIYTIFHYQHSVKEFPSLQSQVYADIYQDMMNTPFGKWLTESPWMYKVTTLLVEWYNNNKAFQLLCGLPFYAIATRIVFRNKTTYNTTEYSFLVGYISCIILFISILFLWFPSAGNYTTLTLIEVVILPLVYYRFFGGKWWSVLLRVIGMYLLASGLILLSGITIGVLIATIIKISGLVSL